MNKTTVQIITTVNENREEQNNDSSKNHQGSI